MSTEFKMTPKAFRALLPGKIAAITEYIAENDNITPLDALRKFYSSATYQMLEREDTKCWWESPTQLYQDYRAESELKSSGIS